MKKLVLATAVAALYATSAQAAPTVYGKAGVNLEYNDESEATTLTDAYSSRFGVKGTIKGMDGVKAIYKAEFGINAFDEGDEGKTDKDGKAVYDQVLENRVTYVGVGSDQMGMITAGRQGNFVKDVATDADLFASVGSPSISGGSRHGNVLAYTTPSSLPVTLQAGVKLSEVKDGDNVYLVQGTYEDNGLKLGVGTQQFEAKGADDLVNVGASYSMDGITVGGGYQYKTESEMSVGYGSAAYGVAGTPITLKGQVVYDEKYEDTKGASEVMFAVGAEYQIAKKAMAEVYAGQDHNEDTIIGTGLVYKF